LLPGSGEALVAPLRAKAFERMGAAILGIDRH
jgi:hypothetical protein